jgi:3-methyladenine DNA glycosylase AlkD
MNTVDQVLKELKSRGDEQTRKTFARHGAPKDSYGVKISELKIIAKKIKGNQQLACDLYDSGNSDAMYLAGLVADGSQMSKKQLESWAEKAAWHTQSHFTVPWVAAESPFARELALKWIKSKKESIASTGWCTYTGILATKPDEELDLAEIDQLLTQIEKNIHSAPNYVRYVMNGFVIAVGTYVKPLLKRAKAVAKAIGAVEVDMGDTACKVPLATEYIAKVEDAGKVGKKRKTNKC